MTLYLRSLNRIFFPAAKLTKMLLCPEGNHHGLECLAQKGALRDEMVVEVNHTLEFLELAIGGLLLELLDGFIP